MATIVVTDEAGAPAIPAAGVTVFYSVGGVLYTLDSTGTPRTFLSTSVLTTQGDLLYWGVGVPARLGIGTPGQLLRASAGSLPEWATIGASDVGAVATSLFTTNGDMVYRTGAGAVARLPAGAPGTVLTIDGGGIPGWAASAASVPWTALVTEGLVTTVDATPTAVVTEAQQGAAGGILFDFEVTALYRDLSAMYSWKVLATVRDDGAGTLNLQDAVVTPTDPGGPLAIAPSISGTDLIVTATGIGATTIDWYKSGTRKFFPQGP